MSKVIVSPNRTSGVDAAGVMYSTAVHTKTSIVRWNGSGYGIVQDAVKLGLIPRKRVAAIQREYDRREKLQHASYAATNVLHNASAAGLILTPQQERKLKKTAVKR